MNKLNRFSAVCLLIATLVASVLSVLPTSHAIVWGGYGSGDGQFSQPFGVAVDGSGNVYVADSGNNRIQKFSGSGVFLTKWSGSGSFDWPTGIAVDGSGYVYVADTMHHRIQKFNNNGVFQTQWGTSGSGDGQFDQPVGIDVDAYGNVYVADSLHYRIQKFSGDGTFITKWGSPGTGDDQFLGPVGVAVDSSGNVYVADLGLHCIKKFSGSGTFITKWGSQGSGDGQFYQPHGVAVDSSGNVYVAESLNHRVQKFSGDGTFIAKWGSQGSGDGQFFYPRDVAVDGLGNVYVVDQSNNRIQRFQFPASPPRKYEIIQDGVSHVVEPIRGTVSALDFYNYVPQTPAQVVTTSLSNLLLLPNPLGVGQQITISTQIQQAPPPGQIFHGLQLHVSKSAGFGGWQGEIFFADTDPSGNAFFTYTPTSDAYYAFQVLYPGETYDSGNIAYLPCLSDRPYGSIGASPGPYPGTPPVLTPFELQSGGSGQCNFMEAQKSKIYLYEAPDGALSLIIHHGKEDPSSGIMQVGMVVSGLPVHAYVALSDDVLNYGSGTPEFSKDIFEGTTGGTWNKAAGESDGAIISGLEQSTFDWEIGVIMRANPPGVDSWEYQTDDSSTIHLDMANTPNGGEITIRPCIQTGITVQNIVEGVPPGSDWNYLLMQGENVVQEFTLPDGGGSSSFPSLEAGTYWLAQTIKSRYTTSITVDDVDVPATTVENKISLTLNLLPGQTSIVVFTSAPTPDAAFTKSAGGSSGSTPSAMTYNVPPGYATPVQVSWNPDIQPDGKIDLVKDKPIKILVNASAVLTPGPVSPTDTTRNVVVSVTSSNGRFNALQATVSGADIKSNNITVFSLNPLSVLGEDTLTCTIVYGSAQTTFSTKTTSIMVKETSQLALYYSHLYRTGDYGTELASAYDTMLTNTRDFINAVYPVPSLTVDSNAQGSVGAAYEANYVGMLKDCQYIEQQAKLRFPNSPNAIGIAIAPDLLSGGSYKNYFAYHGAVVGKKTAVGVSFGPGVKGVVVLDGYYSAAAHEIGHTFGLYYGVPEQYETCNPGMPSNGFWAEQNQWRAGYDFMGLSPYKSTVEMWANTASTFDPIFSSVKTPGSDPQILLVNGIIYKDSTTETVELPYTWYSMPYGTADTVPDGQFALRFTLADGSTVETRFDAKFFLNLDPGTVAGEDLQEDFTGFGTIPVNFAGFAFATEYPAGTTSIQLLDKSKPVGEQVLKTISPASVVPSVSAYFGGFLQPINADGSSIFKQGSTVPVKFQLKSSEGKFITNAQARLFLSFKGTEPQIPATSTAAPKSSNMFRYDATSNQYIFNLDTKNMAKGNWQLRVDLGDGTPPKTVNIVLK